MSTKRRTKDPKKRSKSKPSATGKLRLRPPRRAKAEPTAEQPERRQRQIHERLPPPPLSKGSENPDESPSPPIELTDVDPKSDDHDDPP